MRCDARPHQQGQFPVHQCFQPIRSVRERPLLGAMPAAGLGGVGTVAVALLWMKLFPALRHVERLE
jgi:hypothetical protein